MRNLIILLLVFISFSLQAQELPDLIPFVHKNKWGYCDSTQKVIIPAQYHSAEPFEHGLALVWEYSKDVNQKVLIDSKGNRVEVPYPILSRQENGDFLILSENGNFGYMSKNLEVLVKPEYTGIGALHGDYIELSKDHASGIYDVRQKKWAWPLRKNNYTEHIFGPFYGLGDGEMGYTGMVNAVSGKIIHKDLTMAYDAGSNHAIVVFDDARYGWMNDQGEILFTTKARLCYPADANRIGFTMDEKKYGFMNAQGKIMIEAQYDQIFNFKNSRALVAKDHLFGIIDTSGAWVVAPEFMPLNHWFNEFSEKVLPLNKGDSTYYFDRQGKIIYSLPKINSYTGFQNGLMCISKEEKFGNSYGFMNEKGTFITDYKYSSPSVFINGLAKVTVTTSGFGLTVYYIDKYGKEYYFKD